MKITILNGCTATKVGDEKPTRFYGGETENIVDSEAKQLIKEGAAGLPNNKLVREAQATILARANERTRRQDLGATTPGLAEKLALKRRLAGLGESLNGAAASVE